MITILNQEKIPQFQRGSTICKKIRMLCTHLKLAPKVQVFRSKKPLAENGVRGATYGDLITLYWSDLETEDSMLWVFCHELRHHMMFKFPNVFQQVFEIEESILKALSKKKIAKIAVHKQNRVLYAFRPTELIGDLFATEIMGKSYGDDWYETRINRRKGKKNEQGNKNGNLPPQGKENR